MSWRRWKLPTWKKTRFYMICQSLKYIIIINKFLTYLNHQADKAIAEIEARCNKQLEECKEESRQHLMRIQEEQTQLVCTKET